MNTFGIGFNEAAPCRWCSLCTGRMRLTTFETHAQISEHVVTAEIQFSRK